MMGYSLGALCEACCCYSCYNAETVNKQKNVQNANYFCNNQCFLYYFTEQIGCYCFPAFDAAQKADLETCSDVACAACCCACLSVDARQKLNTEASAAPNATTNAVTSQPQGANRSQDPAKNVLLL